MLWLIAFISVLLHEASHAAIAVAYKCPPTSIELTPLGAVMLLEDEMRLPPLKRALMLLAGPVASLCLCWVSIFMTSRCWISATHGMQIFISNMSIVLINLLPVFPLDGGRLLHLCLCRLLPLHVSACVMRILGSVAGIGLIGLNLLMSLKYGGWNISLAFAGCSILYSTSSAMTTSKLHELRAFMDRKIILERKGRLKCCTLCVMANLPIKSLLRALPAHKQSVYIVIEPGTMNILGLIGENQVIQHYLNAPVANVGETLRLSQNLSEIARNDTK